MRLTQEVSLVGGGLFGFDLSAPYDCNVYLLDGGDELAIVDAGIGSTVGDTSRLLKNISGEGFDTSRISRLLLTHYHADHAGGAAEIQQSLGCAVHGSRLTARTLTDGDEEQISLPAAKAAGLFPPEYVFKPCEANGDLTDGKTFNIGQLKVRVFDTPGHCDGHLSFLVEGLDTTYLIEGDVVFFGGKIFLQNIPDCSLQKYAASVRKLAELEFDALLPGHLGISLANGKRHIEMAAETFGRLLVPESIV